MQPQTRRQGEVYVCRLREVHLLHRRRLPREGLVQRHHLPRDHQLRPSCQSKLQLVAKSDSSTVYTNLRISRPANKLKWKNFFFKSPN
jgi:hypothetical protein